MFSVDKNYNIAQPLSQFFASELINREWIEPGAQQNTIFPASSAVSDGAGHRLVTAYADLRPDGQWSLMLVNRDQEVAHTIHIVFQDKDTKSTLGFSGDVHAVTFGSAQYAWHPETVSPMSYPEHPSEPVIVSGYGHADPDGPPKQEDLHVTPASSFEIPAASIMVLRGKLAPAE
jgi:hypothetical protein